MAPKSSMEPLELGPKNRYGHISMCVAAVSPRCRERSSSYVSLYYCRLSWNTRMSFQRTWNLRSSLRTLQKRSDCQRYDFILGWWPNLVAVRIEIFNKFSLRSQCVVNYLWHSRSVFFFLMTSILHSLLLCLSIRLWPPLYCLPMTM